MKSFFNNKRDNELYDEFCTLRDKLFQGASFAVMDETDPDTKRYNQLFQYLNPMFRTKDWVSPITPTVTDIYKSILGSNGASYNFVTKVLNPTTGYMVAVPGYETTIDMPIDQDAFEKQLVYYIMKVDTGTLLNNNHYVGIWRIFDKLMFDIAENIQDRNEAIRQGKKREQLAIYDCANKQDIDTRIVMEMGA